jgi:putative phage-type endonuclease
MDGLNMEQRSEKWFAARKGRVTGSMVGAVLGLDPNCTRAEAMRRMVRSWQGLPSEFQGNIATQWGVMHEQEAREAFEYHSHLTVEPASFVVHSTMDWIGASPDGYVGGTFLLETKCPFGMRAHEKPVPFKTVEEQPHYYAQMQIQMFVTGCAACYFYQWTPNDSMVELVGFSQEWIDENLPKLEAFYQEFLSICDDEIEDTRPAVDDPRALQLLAEYDDLQDAILRADERKSEILADIVAMCGGKNSIVCGRKLSKVEKVGSISYAKAIKELAPNADLEKWRGKPSSYWMLK